MDIVLVTGAGGQLGTELTLTLREQFGTDQVIATDIRPLSGELTAGPTAVLDVMDQDAFTELVAKHKVTQIYHLAAILSARGEQNPQLAWQLNMDSLLTVLGLARDYNLHKVYWPSSIAVFGTNTPMDNTPQDTIMDPTTVYGISKLAGERWCEYYHLKHGVDVRSLRYPGLIGWKTLPGGGTTDYAVDIYHQALKQGAYTCFLKEDAYLPMMYMPDAISATLQLMNADPDKVKVRSSYNVGALSFSPKEITQSIQAVIPDFTINYEPDYRQAIADSWPNAVDDQAARTDWGWSHAYTLDKMTEDILTNLRKQHQQALLQTPS